MRVLVTGASGFVGRALCPALTRSGHQVTAAVRSVETLAIDGASRTVVIGDLGPDTDWTDALKDQDAIIHLAARAHVMTETAADPEPLYRRVNVEATQRLLEQADACEVRRLIFLSSIKVNGEATTSHPFTEDMAANPQDAYGRTKHQAEQIIAAHSTIKSTVLRAPLVYGPGVKGNFLKLVRLCGRGLPMPLGAIRNQRSLVYLENLVDALVQVLENDQAIGQTYLLSDGTDISTPELFQLLGEALNRRVWLVPVPVFLLRLAGALSGKSAIIHRLCDSLQVDSQRIRRHLGWTPPFSLQQGLEKTADWDQNHWKQQGAQNAS